MGGKIRERKKNVTMCFEKKGGGGIAKNIIQELGMVQDKRDRETAEYYKKMLWKQAKKG